MATLTAICLASLILSWFAATLRPRPTALIDALALLSYVAGGGIAAVRALILLSRFEVTIDLLMVTAALGAASVGAWSEGAILLFLFSLSNTLERFALHRTRRAIEDLLDLSPTEATVRRAGGEERIPTSDLRIGDVVVVRPGERIPADGVVVFGQSSIDQSPVTGESIPVDKECGDTVFAGTLNQQGAIEIRVTREPSDTTLQRIIRLVEEAQSEKAQTQQLTDWFGRRYTLGVFAASALTFAIPWLLLGQPSHTAFYRAMTVLVVASPCAVVISIPAAILSAIARGARHGILFKGGAHLEQAARIDAIAFDKTGTLTLGRPLLTRVLGAPGVNPDDVLRLAASAESRSEHPLGRAIVEGANVAGHSLLPCESLTAVVGKGIKSELSSGTVWVGKRDLIEAQGLEIPPSLLAAVEELAREGHTVMYVADQMRTLGAVAAMDTLRPTALEAVARLRALGIQKLLMLTGDHAAVARAIAAQVGIAFEAELLPSDKQEVIRALTAEGRRVAMVGDGINDAPSLATASLGVALGGSSTDVALETADLVLMGDDLRRLPEAIGLARATNRIIRQNLVFAFTMMGLLLLATFAESLRLPFAVVGHEGSTVLVILNGLRLLAYRP